MVYQLVERAIGILLCLAIAGGVVAFVGVALGVWIGEFTDPTSVRKLQGIAAIGFLGLSGFCAKSLLDYVGAHGWIGGRGSRSNNPEQPEQDNGHHQTDPCDASYQEEPQKLG